MTASPVAYTLRDKHTGLFLTDSLYDTKDAAIKDKEWLEDPGDDLEIVPLVPLEKEEP